MSIKEYVEIMEILRMLPHRFPFVMVDRVLEFEAGERIKGLKNVTMNEPFFPGHFPSEPVMPGVLIVEGMAQTAAVLAYLTHPDMVGNKIFYFAGIDGVRFRRKVVPGDQLIFELQTLKWKSKMIKMAGKAYVEGEVAAEAELMAIFA